MLNHLASANIKTILPRNLLNVLSAAVLLSGIFASPSFAQSKDAAYLPAIKNLDVASMRSALNRATAHGLNSSDYWTEEMETRYRNNMSDPTLASATATAYLKLLRHLSLGRVNPEELGKNFLVKRKDFISPLELEKLALESNGSAERLAEAVAPKTAHYRSLLEALRRFSQSCSTGTWATIRESSASLTWGMRDPSIKLVKERLRQFGYPVTSTDDLFDDQTLHAVNNIQSVLQMRPDGVISPGGGTWKYLNEPCAKRVLKIRADLEKMRWLPQQLGNRYLFVNSAHNYLTWIDQEAGISRTMKVIVGRPTRQTPTLIDRIEQVVVNPYWVVPPTVFKEDKLSDLRNLTPWQVHSYFEQNNYEVWDESFEFQMAPSSINWPAVTNRTPILIRQKPGLHNALGVLKFNLTNDEAIYLHDTNSRHLFGEAARQLSSGCVRVESPFDLAEYVLQGTKWTRSEIEMRVGQPGQVVDKPQYVTVPKPLSVFMVHQTVTMNSDGVIRFAQDNYGQAELLGFTTAR